MFGFIGRWISGIASVVWKAFKPYLQKETTRIVGVLLEPAKEVVIEVARDLAGADNEDKRREAFNRLKKIAEEKYEDVSDRFINATIEIAVDLAKDQLDKIEKENK